MYKLTHIESGFEWSFPTLAEAIEYLETFERQEEFEIRRQTARSIFYPSASNICSAGPGVGPGDFVKKLTRLFFGKYTKGIDFLIWVCYHYIVKREIGGRRSVPFSLKNFFGKIEITS